MDVNEISALVSSVGFPIVACIFMYIQQTKLNETMVETSFATIPDSDIVLFIIEATSEDI